MSRRVYIIHIPNRDTRFHDFVLFKSTSERTAFCAIFFVDIEFAQSPCRKSFWIRRRITKHLIKHRLPQVVQPLDGAAAGAAQRIGLVEDRRDASLLIEEGQGNQRIFNYTV